jgi:Flp pilus assembly protein TadB
MNSKHVQLTTMADQDQDQHSKHRSHRWMMVACCIPMLGIALLLVATGVIGASFLFFAVACTAVMAMMMGGMDHGGNSHKR